MTSESSVLDQLSAVDAHRRAIRYFAAALSTGCAVVYFMIGLGLVYEDVADAPSLLYFGVPAGLSFVLGATLLVATDRRILWVLGAIYQAFVILAYIGVAERRDPPFEMVGIALKVAQVGIFCLLLALIRRPPTGESGTAGRPASGSPTV
jgi:FtsH-binding integral membrane protein